MKVQDFQNICATLKNKYEEKRLTDDDVDAFADVITNVLDREDLRAEGTDYAELSQMICEHYEGDIAMNPLLARMYELCRMYERFRPRPLTDMERKEEQMEIGKSLKTKHPARISVYKNGNVIASCWWADLRGIDGIVEQVGIIISSLIGNDRPSLEDIAYAFARTGSGIEILDENAARLLGNDFPRVNTSDDGIIAVDPDAIERNRYRGGSEARIDIDAKTARVDCYTVYGLSFYQELTKKSAPPIEELEMLKPEDVEFPWEVVQDIVEDWHNRLGNVFALEGSDKLVGTKTPLPTD